MDNTIKHMELIQYLKESSIYFTETEKGFKVGVEIIGFNQKQQ